VPHHRSPSSLNAPATRLTGVEAHFRAGRHGDAVPTLLALVRDFPADPRVLNMLANALYVSGKIEQATYYARRAVEHAPDNPSVHVTLGHTLFAGREFDEAAIRYALAWKLGLREPPVAHAHLACLRDSRRWVEGADIGRTYLTDAAIQHHPLVAMIAAECLTALGRVEDALHVLETSIALAKGARAGTIAPIDLRDMLVARASGLNYVEESDVAKIDEAHAAVAEVLSRGVTASQHAWASKPRTAARADAPLRVGLISGDLRQHSCSWFVRPLLLALDRQRIQIHCYATLVVSDEVTRELRALLPDAAWHDVSGRAWTHQRIAQQVSSDAIDILIDCSGFTSHQRLRAFAYHPAPLQLSWLGYPHDTGMPAIAARITDIHADPVRSARTLHISDTDSQSRFLCYHPPDGAGTPAARTARSNDSPFTFCCFGSLQKFSPPLLRAWSTILARAPQARLAIKSRGTDMPQVRDDVLARLRDFGIPIDRVELLAHTPDTNSHLACYRQCDLHLDTFPYAGTTTTCESLFMGVPMLTRAGTLHAGRVGVSLLTSVGLDALIAPDIEAYIDLAVGFANDPASLDPHSHNLRDRLHASPLCDAPRFASAMAGLLESALAIRMQEG